MKKTHYEKLLNKFPAIKTFFKEFEEDGLSGEFSFEEFIGTRTAQKLFNLLPRNVDIQSGALMTQIMFHFCAFKFCAGRMYEISDNIAEMLLNTKLDIDSSMVKSPFPEIMVLVPDNLLSIYNKHTGFHNVYTIYINIYDGNENERLIKILCVGKPNEKSVDEFDDATFYFKIPLLDGKVSHSLKKAMEDWEKSDVHKVFSTVNDTDKLPRIFQFVLNVLLYITSSDSDIRLEKSNYDNMLKKLNGLKSASKKRKLGTRIGMESKLDKYIVGGSIQLSPEEKGILDASRAHGSKHGIRYPVGGHWRNQPYGPKNSLRRHKWIKPHFRGPEFAELIKNIGVLK